MAWSMDDITDWLNKQRATIYLHDGVPRLVLPSTLKEWQEKKLLETILPQLKARRQEIIAKLQTTPAQLHDPQGLIAKRAQLVAELRAEAHAANKPLWWLWPHGIMSKDGQREPGISKFYRFPPQPTHGSVGGKGWVKLPITLPPAERTRTKKRRPRKTPGMLPD